MADVKNLKIGIIDKPGHPEFDNVYSLYERIFTLPEERVSREGFIAGLNKNITKEYQDRNEKGSWVYLKDEETGKIAGAAYFVTFAGSKTPGFDGSLHATYIFVDPEYRHRGVFKDLVTARENVAADYCREVNPSVKDPVILTFTEQNSPFKMTARQYIQDTELAGIDQIDRRNIFGRAGYRTVESVYIQPRFSAEEKECLYLDPVVKLPDSLAKRNPPVTDIPSSVVEEHIERFIGRSFGTTLDNPNLTPMRESLQGQKKLALHRSDSYAALSSHISVEKLRELPPDKLDMTLGELYPELEAKFNKEKIIKGNNMSAKLDMNKTEVIKIDGPKHQLFNELYKVYQGIFTMPEEQESQANFNKYLADNVKKALSSENWVVLRDKESGEIIGASNFGSFANGKGSAKTADGKEIGIDSTAHGIYLLVPEKHQKKGVFPALLQEREKAVAEFYEAKHPGATRIVLNTICEQNSPALMTPRQFLGDIKDSAMNPFDRGTVFQAQGFQTLDYRYLQPNLGEAGDAACTYLHNISRTSVVEKVDGAWKTTEVLQPVALSAQTIVNHYERGFFKDSFPKGTSLGNKPLARMENDLGTAEYIPLLPPGKEAVLAKLITPEMVKQAGKDAPNQLLGVTFKNTFGQVEASGKFNQIGRTALQSYGDAAAKGSKRLDTIEKKYGIKPSKPWFAEEKTPDSWAGKAAGKSDESGKGNTR